LEDIMRIVAALLLLVCIGCGIPKEIATEIDMLDTIVSIAVKETAKIADPEQRATIAVNALKRAEPHTENLKCWVEKEMPRGD
jgi:hypothetical protein